MPVLFLLIALNLAPARAHTSYCGHYLGSPGTAEAEPENLVQVMISLWPRARAIFDHLDAKFREGFRQRGISDHEGETILAHIFDVVRATRLVALRDATLDLRRMMWMALIHDFAEHLVPDYTPRDRIPPAEKYRQEFAAMEEIVAWLGPDADFILKLWVEFEENVTREARLVRQLDALDAVVKACIYERHGYDVEEFFDSIIPRVSDPHLMDVLGQLLMQRNRAYVDYREFYFGRLGRY